MTDNHLGGERVAKQPNALSAMSILSSRNRNIFLHRLAQTKRLTQPINPCHECFSRSLETTYLREAHKNSPLDYNVFRSYHLFNGAVKREGEASSCKNHHRRGWNSLFWYGSNSLSVCVILGSQQHTRNSFLFFPGKGNDCQNRYNFFCKFWFYVRCYLFAAFPRVRILGKHSEKAFIDFRSDVSDGDIAVILWRNKQNHTFVPEILTKLLQFRNRAKEDGRNGAKIKIGVFHVANENDRVDWPWYTLPDFVIRNYWVPNAPKQVLYVPCGPQMPNQCTPWSTKGWKRPHLLTEPICECGGLKYAKASTREFLWNFSGSLRRNRGQLLRDIRNSSILEGKGFQQIATKFGGDGKFGDKMEDPKASYLESIENSQFVFAPCGNVMETHRIYEALSLGAIPVIENCEPHLAQFFPFRELIIDGEPSEMVKFVESFAGNPDKVDALQKRMVSWWSLYSSSLADQVLNATLRNVPMGAREAL